MDGIDLFGNALLLTGVLFALWIVGKLVYNTLLRRNSGNEKKERAS